MTILDGLKRLLIGPDHQPIPTLGRNDRCWCGSDKKYKMCHLSSDNRKRMAERNAAGAASQGGMF